MADSAERQRRFRERKRMDGFVSVTVFVPEKHAAAFNMAAKELCRDEDLELGPMRNVINGKLQGWK